MKTNTFTATTRPHLQHACAVNKKHTALLNINSSFAGQRLGKSLEATAALAWLPAGVGEGRIRMIVSEALGSISPSQPQCDIF